ncbi:MAG: dienelactone hydrolase family protein [Phycisphaerae bacterium]
MRRGARVAAALGVIAACGTSASGKVISKTVEYRDGDVTLEGYLALDDVARGPRPGVLVVHEWWGCNAFAHQKADELAGLGYVAFALDMYGKGKTTTERKQASEWSGQFYKDTALLRTRALAGLKVLASQPGVDRGRIAAIGFCFGGTTVLNLALSGADLRAVVSFHGGLIPFKVDADKPVKAKILVCHGADDPMIEAKAIGEFQATCRAAKADWQMVYYGNAVHSFTNPRAGAAGIAGVAYDEPAAKRSWQAMRALFDEVFAH